MPCQDQRSSQLQGLQWLMATISGRVGLHALGLKARTAYAKSTLQLQDKTCLQENSDPTLPDAQAYKLDSASPDAHGEHWEHDCTC